MPNPFPGMNPWLENPAIWRDVHHRLISAIANHLAPRLRPRYFVAVETHTFISLAPDTPGLSRYPEVMVVERTPVVKEVAVQEYTPYITVDVPLHEPVEQGYIEVRLVPGGEVVTVIELLSHANKQVEETARPISKNVSSFLT